jgi:hypothetical protein
LLAVEYGEPRAAGTISTGALPLAFTNFVVRKL